MTIGLLERKLEPDEKIVFELFQVCSQVASLEYRGRVLKVPVGDFRTSRRNAMDGLYSRGIIDEDVYGKLVNMNHSR